jgi:hypothetical protein
MSPQDHVRAEGRHEHEAYGIECLLALQQSALIFQAENIFAYIDTKLLVLLDERDDGPKTGSRRPHRVLDSTCILWRAAAVVQASNRSARKAAVK